MKNKKQKTRGGPGLSPPSGSRKYAQGGQGGGAGKQHQVRAGGMALRVGFEQGFPGLDHYWCRHTSPHEVSGAQCLSRRLILAVFQLVFVFRLGGPTPSEAAGGRPHSPRDQNGTAWSQVLAYVCTVVHEAYCSPLLFTRPTVVLLLTITTTVQKLTLVNSDDFTPGRSHLGVMRL